MRVPSRIRGRGWIPDHPDFRDKTLAKEKEKAISPREKTSSEKRNGIQDTFEVWRSSFIRSQEILKKEKAFKDSISTAFPQERKRPSILLEKPREKALPARVDLRVFMSPVENQEEIGSCTAHAVIGLIEYLQIVLTAGYIDMSRLFLYKATRNLMGWQGDDGAYIRETVKALKLFGACPEEYWPYNSGEWNGEPSSFCYAFGSNFKSLCYYRLLNLEEIKSSLHQGYPVAFGFTCFESLDLDEVTETGIIPYPHRRERSTGGHAVLAVGYFQKGKNDKENEKEPDDQGYLIIRNSWGEEWGDGGYGYLPYSYIQGGGNRESEPISEDYWSIAYLTPPDIPASNSPPFLLSRPSAPRTPNSRTPKKGNEATR